MSDLLGIPTDDSKEVSNERVADRSGGVSAGSDRPSDRPVEETDDILAALMARMTPFEARTKWLKAHIYGPPGVGKTVFACGIPKTLLVAVEAAGPDSLANHPDIKDNVTVLEFKSVKQVELLIQKFKEGKLDQFDSIVIDSFSEFQKRDLDDVVRKAASMDSARNKYLPIGPDYNMNTEHMRQILSDLADLPKHIILISHVKEEKDESTGRVLLRPNLTPKLAGSVAGMVSLTGYLSTQINGGNVTRTLQVQPSNTISAKTRIGGLPAVIDNPSMADILSAYNTHKEN